MDKDKFYKKNGVNIFRVDKISNLEIETFFINSEYKIRIINSHVTETGLLTIFTLLPTNQQLPSFITRWDQNYGTLDVDILGVEKQISEAFKKEKKGYLGHHPQKISKEKRTYFVKIKLPNVDIFSGNVAFNINHGHSPNLFKHIFIPS